MGMCVGIDEPQVPVPDGITGVFNEVAPGRCAEHYWGLLSALLEHCREDPYGALPDARPLSGGYPTCGEMTRLGNQDLHCEVAHRRPRGSHSRGLGPASSGAVPVSQELG